jgi:aspartate 1-decarboxylase
MLKVMLHSRISRVRVTRVRADEEESCRIDATLLVAAGIQPNQCIDICNITTGEHFQAYAAYSAHGSREVSVNGVLARKVSVADTLTICMYATFGETEAATHRPLLVTVDEGNKLDVQEPMCAEVLLQAITV